MGVGREREKGIQRAEGVVYKGAGVGSSRYRQKNEDGSRCIRLCNGGYIIDGMWRRFVEASGLPF